MYIYIIPHKKGIFFSDREASPLFFLFIDFIDFVSSPAFKQGLFLCKPRGGATTDKVTEKVKQKLIVFVTFRTKNVG